METGHLEQLRQLLTATYDGDLISKQRRDCLVKKGLAVKCHEGWNIITPRGIEILVNLALLHD